MLEHMCYYEREVLMKLLKVAIENQRWDVAAHALVISMVKAKQNTTQTSNGKRKPSRAKSKRRQV